MLTPPESFVRRDVSVSMAEANVYALFTSFPPALLLVALYVALWGFADFLDGAAALLGNPVLALIGLVGGILLHEIIHAVTWMIAGRKSLKSVRLGFQIKTFTPYAHCVEPMEARAYRIGAFMPGLLMGLLPSGVALATGDGGLMLFGAFFTLAAGGDFLILWILRSLDKDALVEDHPTRAGCYVLENTSPVSSPH